MKNIQNDPQRFIDFVDHLNTYQKNEIQQINRAFSPSVLDIDLEELSVSFKKAGRKRI